MYPTHPQTRCRAKFLDALLTAFHELAVENPKEISDFEQGGGMTTIAALITRPYAREVSVTVVRRRHKILVGDSDDALIVASIEIRRGSRSTPLRNSMEPSRPPGPFSLGLHTIHV